MVRLSLFAILLRCCCSMRFWRGSVILFILSGICWGLLLYTFSFPVASGLIEAGRWILGLRWIDFLLFIVLISAHSGQLGSTRVLYSSLERRNTTESKKSGRKTERDQQLCSRQRRRRFLLLLVLKTYHHSRSLFLPFTLNGHHHCRLLTSNNQTPIRVLAVLSNRSHHY
jgi:hypothetical protein